MIIVVIGVTGAGKSTVGAALAGRLGWRFIDADDFHSEANWRKLERGIPLNDANRAPWLERLQHALSDAISRGESAVLACSALRRAYRAALVPPDARPRKVRFVHLDAPPSALESRLANRTRHRASATLLQSQLDQFEPAPDALRVNAADPPARIVQTIVSTWGLVGRPQR